MGSDRIDDRLVLRGDADSTLSLADLGTRIIGFDSLIKEGASNWTLTGANTMFGLLPVDVQAGTLTLSSAQLGFLPPMASSAPEPSAEPGPVTIGIPRLRGLPVTVAANATLAAIGASSIVGDVTNAGTLSMRNGQAADQLQIFGDLTGQGGTLAFDTLMSDTADGGTTDRLTVAGALGGSHAVVINPLGAGAETQDDGILLVAVNGSSTPDALAMDGGGLLHGGFMYRLQQGGADEKTANNWYLQSTAVAGGSGVAIMPVAQLGFGTVASMAQRGRKAGVGGGTPGLTTSTKSAMGGVMSGFWASASASRGQGDLNRALAGNSYDTAAQSLAFGLDLAGQGDWTFGVSARAGRLRNTVFDGISRSTAKADAIGIGASATWQGPSSTYVDLQAQYTWFSTDYATAAGGTIMSDAAATAYSVGAEVGAVWAMGADLSVTPFAQLAGTVVQNDAFTAAGSAYDLGRNSTLIGRIGAQVDYTPQPGQRYYASAVLSHDFNPANGISINGTDLTYDSPGTSLAPTLGVELFSASAGQITAEVSYQTDLDKGRSATGVNVLLGYTKSW